MRERVVSVRPQASGRCILDRERIASVGSNIRRGDLRVLHALDRLRDQWRPAPRDGGRRRAHERLQEDGAFYLDVVQARRVRDLDDEGLVQIALRDLGLKQLVITVADLKQEPR